MGVKSLLKRLLDRLKRPSIVYTALVRAILLANTQSKVSQPFSTPTKRSSGALVYLALDSLDLRQAIPVAVAGLVVVLVRELSIKFNWNLPTIPKGN